MASSFPKDIKVDPQRLSFSPHLIPNAFMPSLNFTFQESSPLIVYSAGWDAIYDHGDPFRTSYNGIFRPTSKSASATLSFLGTGVSIFGATRTNHGPYSVVLDDQPPFQGDGHADPNRFNISLFGATDLQYQNHKVTITNMPQPGQDFLDIDYISIERQFGNPTDNLFNLNLDDTSTLVSYKGSWNMFPTSSAFNNSQRRSAVGGDQVSFAFKGCSVEVYGQYANADYSAVVDSDTPITYRGFDQDLVDTDQQPQTLLFLADNLDEDKEHVVLFTNLNTNDNRPFFFDYAVLRSVRGDPQVLDLTQNATGTSSGSASNPTNATSPASSSSPASHSNASNAGPIAGGVVGGILALALALLGVFLWRRKRSRSVHDAERGPLDPEPYLITYSGPTTVSHPVGTNSKLNSTEGRYARGHQDVPPEQSHPPSTSSYPLSFSDAAATSSSGPRSYGAATSSSYRDQVSDVPESSRPSHTPRPSNSAIITEEFQYPKSDTGPVSRDEELTPLRENDAGTLPQPGSSSVPVSSLPPAYDPSWDNRRR